MTSSRGNGSTPQLIYVLRLWCDDETRQWRIIVRDATSGQRLGFADLLTLLTFLDEQMATAPAQLSIMPP